MLPDDTQQALKVAVPVTHLMRDAALRPRPAASKVTDGRFTLQLMPLARMIGMFQAHKATISHDKVYALLGMCSDDLNGSGLLPDYQLPWAELLQRLIFHTLGTNAYVKTWDGQSIFYTLGVKAHVKTWDGSALAIMEAHGNILGRVLSIENTSAGPVVEVAVRGGTESHQSFLCDTKDARPNDMVCSISQSRRIVLVRPMGNYFGLLDIALEAITTKAGLAVPPDEDGHPPFSLLLAWDFGSRWSQDERPLDSIFHCRVSAMLDENVERFGDAEARSWAAANALLGADMMREAAIMFAVATRGRANDSTTIARRRATAESRFLEAISTHDGELTGESTSKPEYLECLAWLFDSWGRPDDANVVWLLIYAVRRVISMPDFHFVWRPAWLSTRRLLQQPRELLRVMPEARNALELVSQRGKDRVPVTVDLAKQVDLNTRGGRALMEAILGMDETFIEPEAAEHLFPDVTKHEDVRDYALQQRKIEEKDTWQRMEFVSEFFRRRARSGMFSTPYRSGARWDY